MPEIVEVQVQTDGLQSLIGKEIKDVQMLNEHHIIQGVTQFEFMSILMGARIEDVSRTGKYIIIEVSKAKKGSEDEWWYLLIHFTMTGGFTYKEHKNSRILFQFDDNENLYYKDDRKWSKIWLYGGEELLKHINSKKLGIDALEANAYDIEMELTNKLLNSKYNNRTMKELMLDQSIICGLGNIYASEVLFHAHIHPENKFSEITFDDIQSLSKAIVEVIRTSYERGGSSIKDFTDVFGNPGSFQKQHQVYGRNGLPCFKCQTLIEKYTKGRTTFYCPNCQRREE